MVDISWRRRVARFLKNNPYEEFTAKQIVDGICREDKKFQVQIRRKIEQSGRHKKDILGEFASRITSESKKYEGDPPEFKTITDPRPIRHCWEEESEEGEDEQGEAGLYKPLMKYLKNEWDMDAWHIGDKKSVQREEANNKWLHPDIVGAEILDADWEEETKSLADAFNRNRKRSRLWSFEVKKGKISRSNVRERFFQAVANSSWANFGYLVAEGSEGLKTKRELRMLSGLYGIGVIIFVKDNPENSYILIPAREREEVDWAACNPLAKVNSDFRKFMEDTKKRMNSPNKEIRTRVLEGKHKASEVPPMDDFMASEKRKEEKITTQRGYVNYDFWKKVLDCFHEKQLGLYKNTKSPSKGNWIGPSSGVSGCIYVCRRQTKHVQVEFYIYKSGWTKEKTEKVFDFLHERKEKIEKSFGEELEWDRAEGLNRCRIYLARTVENYDDEEQEIIEWLYDRTQKLEKVFAPHINDLKQVISEG